MANEKSPVNKSENKSSRKKTVVYIALGSTGIAIIFFIFGLIFENIFISHQNKSVTELREGSLNQNKYNYKYINPLLACETASPKSVEEFGTLKDKIDRLINQKIVSGEVINMSVHFDMRDGRWLGINTDELYYPASLLKVPLMIATLKIAEAQPELLLKKNLYTGTTDLTKEQNFKPQEMLQPGHYYTTEDLLKRMIIYSDNNAVPLLLNNINSSTLAAVYSDLGIPMDNSSIRISVKEYANFFRILYNA